MKNSKLIFAFVFSTLLAPMAQAGIIASATRVIFNEGDTEKTLMLMNTNSYPIISQTWVDNGDVNAAPELSHSPFISLPSVFGMQPHALQGLKIVLAGTAMPADRESVFWLNLYEVPPNEPTLPPQRARVTLAMNTQMKIFYRPKVLAGKVTPPSDAASFTLEKTSDGYRVTCHNKSAFYLSLADLSVKWGSRNYPVRKESDMMTAPFSSKAYYLDDVPELISSSGAVVNATLIDDQGHQNILHYRVI
jgi:P pilus assembly chaperone PapD